MSETLSYLCAWLADIDWRIVGLVAAWLLFWRRGEIAAAARLLRKPSKADAAGPLEWIPSGVADAIPAEPTNPVDRAMIALRKHRGELGAELDRLEDRLKEIEQELLRIDQIFPDDETTIPERTY